MTAQQQQPRRRRAQDGAERPVAGQQAPESPAGVLRAVRASQGRSTRKYRNVPQTVDGHRFDSTKEAERYLSLRQDERDGKISRLEVHPRFPLVVHGIDCGVYEGDFAYVTREGVPTVEDVKSAVTRKLPTYRLKKRLTWALYAVEIREV